MKITGVNLVELTGAMDFQGKFWEERLVRPVDLYPEHAAEGETWLEEFEPNRYRMRSIFLRVETDSDGLVGIGGPVDHHQAYILARQLGPQVVGHDPLAVERIWDRLYRLMIHGRKGPDMMALSASTARFGTCALSGRTRRCTGCSAGPCATRSPPTRAASATRSSPSARPSAPRRWSGAATAR